MADSMPKPLCIDLFCGLGGWASGFLAEGYSVIGFDLEWHDYGTGGYPGQLVLQDVLTLHGSQFKNATVIVASPPCQAYSYRAMPWKRAKALPPPDNTLFEACFRIQREAVQATGRVCEECSGSGIYQRRVAYSEVVDEACPECNGAAAVETRYIPMVVENVRGANPWVGRAKWHYGSFYLWGDVPALMPIAGMLTKNSNRNSWFGIAHNTESGHSQNPVNGEKGIPHAPTGHWTTPRENGTKQGGEWWHDPESMARRFSSKSHSRKAASAQIAKIPFPLANWIAKCFRGEQECE